jgi:4-azaleucine resistance transporter AzlC
MIYGALALEAGLSPAAAQAMSAIIFGGSAQFITTQLVAGGAPGLVIILTVAVVNLRHMLYSASVAPYLQHLPLRWKAGLAYLLTDEAYAMAIQHLTTAQGSNKHWFFLGTGLTLWAFWQLSTAAGILLGAVIPASWSLDFTIALTFIALVVPTLKDRPSVAAALAAGVAALLAYSMPYRLGIVVAALLGVAVGVLLESRS